MEEDLIKCPFCGQDEYIVERDNYIEIVQKEYDSDGHRVYECHPKVKNFIYFCIYCKKDF